MKDGDTSAALDRIKAACLALGEDIKEELEMDGARTSFPKEEPKEKGTPAWWGWACRHELEKALTGLLQSAAEPGSIESAAAALADQFNDGATQLAVQAHARADDARKLLEAHLAFALLRDTVNVALRAALGYPGVDPREILRERD